jgi:hypothetical protein
MKLHAATFTFTRKARPSMHGGVYIIDAIISGDVTVKSPQVASSGPSL